MKKFLLVFLCVAGWLSLIGHVIIKFTYTDVSVSETTFQIASFFTFWTNLLIAVYCTLQLTQKKGSGIFSQVETLTALTVFIFIVGLVFHLLLRGVFDMSGLKWVISEVHHTIVPVGMLILWFLSDDKKRGKFQKLLLWLIYPLLYVGYVLLWGSYSQFYPYPFLHVADLGWSRVLLNSAGLLVLMMGLFLLFHYMGKKIKFAWLK